MQSLSFDRAAPYYDRTRARPDDVRDKVTSTLMALGELDQGRRCLEVGIGTGRIGIPLRQRGARVLGIDLSLRMLKELHRKQPGAPVAQADATALPFPDSCFDVAIMSHVLHVIADWRQALLEVQRVVERHGLLLHLWTERHQHAAFERLFERFRNSVEARGGSLQRPGAPSRASGISFWHERGWSHREIEVARWEQSSSVGQVLDNLRQRIWTSTWELPQDVLEESLLDVTSWAIDELGNVEQEYTDEGIAIVDVVRLDW